MYGSFPTNGSSHQSGEMTANGQCQDPSNARLLSTASASLEKVGHLLDSLRQEYERAVALVRQLEDCQSTEAVGAGLVSKITLENVSSTGPSSGPSSLSTGQHHCVRPPEEAAYKSKVSFDFDSGSGKADRRGLLKSNRDPFMEIFQGQRRRQGRHHTAPETSLLAIENCNAKAKQVRLVEPDRLDQKAEDAERRFAAPDLCLPPLPKEDLVELSTDFAAIFGGIENEADACWSDGEDYEKRESSKSLASHFTQQTVLTARILPRAVVPWFGGENNSERSDSQVEDEVESNQSMSTMFKDEEDGDGISSKGMRRRRGGRRAAGIVRDHSQDVRWKHMDRWYQMLLRNGEKTMSLDRLMCILARVHGDCMTIERLKAVLRVLHETAEDLELVWDPQKEEGPEAIRMSSMRRGSSRNNLGMVYKTMSSARDKCESELFFGGFVTLINWHELNARLPKDCDLRRDAHILRDSIIKNATDEMCARYANFVLPEKPAFSFRARLMGVIDPIVGVVICVNTLTIGMSADSDWSGYDVLETIFLIIFTMEILVKVPLSGPRVHFFGDDWAWNWFDCIIVGFALLDVMLVAAASEPGPEEGADPDDDGQFSQVSIIKVARLARLTRLLRLIKLMRLKIFKELQLMVKGVVAGLRTLFWAIVLLLLLVYLAAVLLRQTVGEAQIRRDDGYETVLFSSVAWSMFTVFRLFMGDTSLADGTPLVAHLWERYTWYFGGPYAVFMLFIVFGIFNMVTAVFVENVIDSAQAKKQLVDEAERILVAQRLRSLILLLGGRPEGEVVHTSFWEATQARVKKKFSGVLKKMGGMFSLSTQEADMEALNSDITEVALELALTGIISKEVFLEGLEDPAIHTILDDLEIHMADRSLLFDVLDSDASGELDLCEFVGGLMKLRISSADKSDGVATALGVRSMMGIVRTMAKDVEGIGARTKKTASLQKPPPRQHRRKIVG
eukprot:TRINITY_DN102938_c0_g1_i1.p1 TRINITY_DN102938_c0_g1~~TRINITY_DN102938_c0_g1_i1.p1  ORF type:complete len:959 (+),score=196.80 TRINITY_DN102938_c0_g1_i1:162-3038(+)